MDKWLKTGTLKRSASRTGIRTTDLAAMGITVDQQDDNYEVQRPTDWPVQTDGGMTEFSEHLRIDGIGGYDSRGYAKMKRLIKGYAREKRLRTPELDEQSSFGGQTQCEYVLGAPKEISHYSYAVLSRYIKLQFDIRRCAIS
ncbi:hypothetical protein AVEN_254545-1 [Araneus ventricosus]|uniref:Uncharacterized protein n=1 Tax=Araneus ventricosus TaxID=182803 RepID=A0A4Y2M731_ARAVE|nr:hypothetical protein AVEN_254545-1 [Araneus ventricosus]